MKTFNSIEDFNILSKEPDNKNFYNILSTQLKTGKQITKILSKNLDFKFSATGEIFINFDKNKLNKEDLEKLEKYFNIHGKKFGSRGLGYYGLFGEAYKIENRKKYKKNPKKILESFWNEYDEYISILSKLKNNQELHLVYLDNYRNFILLWSYILVILKKSNKNKYKTNSIDNLAFQNLQEEQLDKILHNLIDLYELTLENIIYISLENNNSNMFMLPDIKNLFNQIKKVFNEEKIISTKKGKKRSLYEFFSENTNNIQLWIEKIFRNIREEDNLGIILSFFLQKNLDLNKTINKNKFKKLIEEFKEKEKKEYILSAMYGGIELGLVAKYLGYESGWINFSVYHFKNKNTYKDINEIIYPLTKVKNLANQQVVIVDDNIDSGNTLDKIRNIFHNNHIPVKLLAVPRLKLDKEERKKFKKFKESKNFKVNNSKKILEIKKHVALNLLYLFPRVEKKGRNINILIERKLRKFRKKFNKEFRSL